MSTGYTSMPLPRAEQLYPEFMHLMSEIAESMGAKLNDDYTFDSHDVLDLLPIAESWAKGCTPLETDGGLMDAVTNDVDSYAEIFESREGGIEADRLIALLEDDYSLDCNGQALFKIGGVR